MHLSLQIYLSINLFLFFYLQISHSLPIKETAVGDDTDDNIVEDDKPHGHHDPYPERFPEENSNNLIDIKKSRNLKKTRRKKSRKDTEGDSTRHIDKIPPPKDPVYDDPPSGLVRDQKISGSNSHLDHSLRAMKKAFEAILDEHAKTPRRTKDLRRKEREREDYDSFIVLKYDANAKKYIITEEDFSAEA